MTDTDLRGKMRTIVIAYNGCSMPIHKPCTACDTEINSILSLIRQRVSAVKQRVEKDYEQAKMAYQLRQYEFPEPKEPTVSDYHDAILEVLS